MSGKDRRCNPPNTHHFVAPWRALRLVLWCRETLLFLYETTRGTADSAARKSVPHLCWLFYSPVGGAAPWRPWCRNPKTKLRHATKWDRGHPTAWPMPTPLPRTCVPRRRGAAGDSAKVESVRQDANRTHSGRGPWHRDGVDFMVHNDEKIIMTQS
jgi:hypothetical protein